MLIIMINKQKANKNAAKKVDKNAPGPGPEPPTHGACRHRVLAAPALLSTAPPLPLFQCEALGVYAVKAAVALARHRYPISLSRGTK